MQAGTKLADPMQSHSNEISFVTLAIKEVRGILRQKLRWLIFLFSEISTLLTDAVCFAAENAGYDTYMGNLMTIELCSFVTEYFAICPVAHNLHEIISPAE